MLHCKFSKASLLLYFPRPYFVVALLIIIAFYMQQDVQDGLTRSENPSVGVFRNLSKLCSDFVLPIKVTAQ